MADLEVKCEARAMPLPPTVLSTVSTDDYSVHPITQTHECNGIHSNKPGLELTIHSCDCGATFYFIDEALNALIAQCYPSFVPKKRVELTGLTAADIDDFHS